MRKTKQRTTKQKTTKRKRFAAMFMASLVCVTGIDVGVLQVSSVTEISADETVPQESQTVAEEPSTEGQFVQVQPVDPGIVDEQPSSEMIPIMEPSVEASTQETTVQEETTAEQQSVEFESTLEQEIEATSVEEKISQEELVEEETSEKETSEAVSQEEASEEETLEETSEEMTSKDEIALFNQNNEDDIMMFSGATLYGVRLTGSGYEPVEEPNTDTWSRTYTLENLLNGYNVISFGDTEMFMHCMGGVLVQGTYNNTGSGFSDGDNIPPSYVKGSYSGNGIYNSRNSKTNNPLYLGTVNTLELVGSHPYVKINGHGGIGDYTVGVYRNDNYFDFAKAKSVVTQDAASVLLAGSSVVTPESGVITVNAGTTVTINSLQGVGQIQIVGQENSMSNTIINILQSGSVTLPQEYINGSQPSVSEQTSGTAIVWNLPNATNVSIPSWNWVGHVLAPNATVYQSSGNYNGTIIGQKVELHSEGHMYPYTGPGFVPTSNDFHVTKLLDNQAPEANQKFRFALSRVDQPEGAEAFVERTAQNVGSRVSFGTVHYNVAGVYVYQIKETSVTNGVYTCDTTVYYAYVNVVANQVDGKTVLSIESIRYYQAIDGKEMAPIANDGITFYNQTVQPTLTQRSVTKRWNDEADNDGKRPASIRVQLYADGEPYGAEVELNEANSWTYTWSDLPEKNGEHVISYTVDEVTVPDGYEKTIEMIENEFIIFNTHDLEQTERSVVKVWDDSNNQDGLRPEGIIVQLYADGEPYGAEVELNETNGWSYTWTELAKYAAGNEIIYTVSEKNVPGDYTTTYDITSETTITITNSYTPGETGRTVRKVWKDSNNQDGIRPESIRVQLYADGEPYGAEVELNETNGWSYTWTGLPEKKVGDYIVYSVEEVEVPEGYTVAYDLESIEKEFMITNTHTPEQTKRSVVKVWDDSNNQDGHRPESIIVQLYADGEPYGAEVELNEANDWEYTWTGLAKYAAGKEIIYTVSETNVPEDYTTTYAADGTVTKITNSYTPGETGRTVRKVWDDSNNQDDIRPGSIKVQLYANGEPCGAEVELNVANDWEWTWKGLEKYAAGKEIVYTVKEVEVPNGYEISDILESDGGKSFTIINTHKPYKTDRSVEKVWNDSSDQDGLRPDSINVQLLADGEPYGAEVELNAANGWTYTWRGLPKYAAGNEIIYTVRETNVPEDYTTTYDTKGKMTTITNTYTPGETGRTVRKVWKDSNNQDGLRPDSITVQLLANGKPCGTEVELNAKNQWSHTWTGLPEKEAGSYIVYTVEEVEVPEGYNVSYDVESAPKEIVITNTYTPEETERSVVKKWDDNNNQDGLRPESIIVQLYANGEPVGDAIELSTANHWRYIWTKLDKYEAGTEILYIVKEIEVPEDYEAAYKEEGIVTTITNSYTPKQIEKTVRKVWKDNDNQNGLRPERILVQLYANGQECGSPVELNEENNWSYTWTGLAEKDAGQTIEYTVKEIGVPTGYAVSYDDKNAQDKEDIESNNSNEMVITNTATDFKVNKISAQDGHELYNTILSIYEVMPDGEISEIKIDTWTSRVNEIHNFGLKLVQGKTYILREEKATHGYKILPGDIEFTVNEDGSIHIISGLDWVCENGEAVIEKIINENGEIVYLIRNTRNEAEEEETEPESSTDPHESQSTTPEETTEEETTSEEETTPEESFVPEETTPEESTTPMQEEESSAPDNTTPAGSTAPTTTPDQTTTPSATTPTSPRAVILGIEDMSSVLGMAMAAFGVIMLAAVAWLYVRNRKNVN